MAGAFKGGVGTFYGDDTLDGQAIKLRFLCTLAAPNVPRWEQAFSNDDGATWETNWEMTFTRAG